MNIKQKIESILFYKGQPVQYKELSSLLEVDIENIKSQILELSEEYKDKGITIVHNDFECEIVTSDESSDLISKIQKKEVDTELSNASLETLSIVLYMGPITRSMIDYVRGVNSQFTVRSLLVRGLIERDPTSKTPQYTVTLDTIKFLGLNKLDELPNYSEIKHELAEFIKQNSKNEGA